MNVVKSKIFFVIPAFNEEKSIGNVITNLKTAGYKSIVVVDDGSRDNTFKEVKKRKVFALKHKVNQGQGAALRTGIVFALKKGAEIVVTFDSDGQHRVQDIPAMLAPVLDGIADITLGSRFLKKTKMPFSRRLLLKGSVVVQWIFCGVLLSDAHNGFRVLNRKAAQAIKITGNRMEHASDIVEEIRKKKLRYKEVPVVIRYTDYSMRKGQGSYFGAIRIVFGMIVNKIKRFF